MAKNRTFALWLAAALAASAAMAQERLSDDQVRQRIIQESIAAYPGNCPCPYNLASNGSRCGGRSAYSRGGGYAPICFVEDVSPTMIAEWRKRREPT